MVRFSILGIAVSALLAASPAAAQSWWWVAGEPGGQEVVFVDADSISADGAVRVLTIRAGGSTDAERRDVDCAVANDAVEAFVCADDATRMESAAMLGSLTPEMAARAIFSAEG